jgi:type IV secretory pathway protease TraF
MVAKHQKIMLAVAVVGLAFLAVKPLINPVPFVIWNASDSVPVGWYE